MVQKILNNLLTYFVSGLLTGGVIAHEYTEQHWNDQCSEWVDQLEAQNQSLTRDMMEILVEVDSLRRVNIVRELELRK